MKDKDFEGLVASIKNLQKMAEPQRDLLFSEIDNLIADKADNYNQIDHLFDDLLNLGFILDIDAAFSKLYIYVANIYPNLADDYLDYYNEYFKEG